MEDFIRWGIFGVPLLHTILEFKKGKDGKIRVARWWISCISIVLFASLSATLCGTAGFFIARSLSVGKPSPVSTNCKILTNSVELKTAKVCQQGLLNYKSNNGFLATGKALRYRCHNDYYWASVFKVEYKSRTSRRLIQAAAEAPKVALPIDCRPNFSSAWNTKDKFKINGTYHCKYTPGKSKVDIVGDNFFNCSAQEPSMFDMVYHASVLFWHSDHSFLSRKSIAVHLMWNIVAFIFSGMSCSIIVSGFMQNIKVLRSKLFGGHGLKKVDDEFEARVQLFCISIALLFFMIWFSAQHEHFSPIYQLLISACLEGSHTTELWNSLQNIQKTLWS